MNVSATDLRGIVSAALTHTRMIIIMGINCSEQENGPATSGPAKFDLP